LFAAAADDNFYGGVSGSPAYDSIANQQPTDAISAEEQAAREQVWRTELAKVSNFVKKMCCCILVTFDYKCYMHLWTQEQVPNGYERCC